MNTALSDSEKNSFLIHKIKEKPFDEYKAHGKDDDVIRISYELSQPVEKAIGCVLPVDEMSGNINQDGIHSDHLKEKGPFFIAQDIYNIIEKRHQ